MVGHLSAAAFEIRSTTNRLKCYSPVQIVFGRDMIIPESFQLMMGFSSPFLRSNDLRSSLLNINARSFLLSCKLGVHTQG